MAGKCELAVEVEGHSGVIFGLGVDRQGNKFGENYYYRALYRMV